MLGPMALSSATLPRADRFARWREELMSRVLRVDVDVPDRGDFRTDLTVLALPRIGLIERRSTPSTVQRDRLLVRDGADDLVFNFAWEGASHWRWPGGESRLDAGQAVVSALNDVCGFRSPSGGGGAAIRVGRARAARMLPSIEQTLAQPFTVPPAALAILKAYLAALAREPSLSASTALLVEHQIGELLAHIFDPSGDLARAEASGGVKAARLTAALADVAARLTSPRLDGAGVARRIGVSERYLRRLMEEQGVSLGAHIREERLKLARRLLEDPRRGGRRISEIADEAGFNDLSYFNGLSSSASA